MPGKIRVPRMYLADTFQKSDNRSIVSSQKAMNSFIFKAHSPPFIIQSAIRN